MTQDQRIPVSKAKKQDVKFEARPKKQPTDYRARTKELMKRYPKVMEHLAK